MRRLLSALFACLLVLASATSASAACTDPLGDINGDNTTNVVDTQCSIISALWGLSSSVGDLPPVCLAGDFLSADINCDGAVNVTDVILVIQLALGGPIGVALDTNQNGLPDLCEEPGGCAAGDAWIYDSCKSILDDDASEGDGIYTIDPDGETGGPSFEVYCDMTTDNGGWTLFATLQSTSSYSTSYWGNWIDAWWNTDHGTPSDPNSAFSNHDSRKFKPLIDGDFILRTTNPNNDVARYQFGFTPSDWDYWDASRNVPNVFALAGGVVNIIGPFHLDNVKVSSTVELTGAVKAEINGDWYLGVFYLGTAPGDYGDNDSEGLGLRYHVGTNHAPIYGFVGGQQMQSLWHLWVR